MPFTPSHAAAVLPFLRTPLPASALVIGSMAPDVPFYLPFDPGLRTHTAAAVGSTDVLLGALAWVVWHGLLAAPAPWAAPRALRARVAGVPLGVRVRLGDLRTALLTAVALAVGSATHVLWDEFTHAGRWGPEVFPLLGEPWGPMPGYRWLQHVSGLLGGLLLLAWLVRWWRRTPGRASSGHRAPWWPGRCCSPWERAWAVLPRSAPRTSARPGTTARPGVVAPLSRSPSSSPRPGTCDVSTGPEQPSWLSYGQPGSRSTVSQVAR